MIIMKFGGTSVGNAKTILNAAEIVKSRAEYNPLVVVSAVGGVTDKLVELSHLLCNNKFDNFVKLFAEIRDMHLSLITELQLDKNKLLIENIEEIFTLIRNIKPYIYRTPAMLHDEIVSQGERLSAHILSRVLTQSGIKSSMVDIRKCLITNNTFSAAIPLVNKSQGPVNSILGSMIKSGITPVTQGFIGATEEGQTTTLGRGGSDYSATLLGSLLDAEIVEIWSDVDGVLTADPSILPQARKIRCLTYNEAAELAYFGARVLHPATLQPARLKSIPVRVLNSHNPADNGTLIQEEPQDEHPGCTIKSIAYKEGLTIITILSDRMLMAHGFMSEVFKVFDTHDTAVDLVATSEVAVSITIDRSDKLEYIIADLEKFASIDIKHNTGIICLVGKNLKKTPGIAGRVFGLMKDIPVHLISHGASEINLNFVVNETDIPTVVKRLHKHFFENI